MTPNQTCRRKELLVDSEGYVFVDGVKVARATVDNDDVVLQFIDRNPERSLARGTRYVEIAVKEIYQIIKQSPLDRR